MRPVPERSVGASFSDEPLAAYGFWTDWTVRPKWNLCAMPGGEESRTAATGKVKAVGEFLKSDDKVLVCTHATFRYAVEALGIKAFDDRLIAIDEFHHVSVNEANVLGGQLKELLTRAKVHVVAMTGSYFRGDAAAVLSPEDEARFATVTYTYYEQLNGYEYLKALDLGYWFYSGSYLEAIGEVLDPKLKTIVHIPNVNSAASSTDKYAEVDQIMGVLGEYQDRDPVTDFHLVRERETGRILKVADLVDDYDSNRRSKVLGALRDPAHRNDRDHVDVIIALGMAKEGFDWIWCEHALTVGYRSSLTEIVQIIGRVTRDAPDKTRAKFTNLIAEPLADQSDVVEAVNDTLKAIAASLLMEQVIAPRFDFTPKDSGPKSGFDYGVNGYRESQTNVGVNEESGIVHVEIKGLKEMSPEAARICREDLNDVIAAVVQDKETLSQGLFNTENSVPQETTQLRIPKIISDRYPELPEEDVEAIRQQVDSLSDDELLTALSEGMTDDIGTLVHVQSPDVKRETETSSYIAEREKCEDFDLYKPLFEAVQADLASGRRSAKAFEKDASIEQGDFFILDGQLVYVAAVGETFKTENADTQGRLRAIYSNGTESNILLRSLQRALYEKHRNGRRITAPDLGPLFGNRFEEGDIETGTIYVLRSLSPQPEIAAIRTSLHKIGVTGGSVEDRIANAKADPTYLYAPVEIVATWTLANIHRLKLEQTIHRVFSSAQLQMSLPGYPGRSVEPREWFVVPLPVIDEVVQKIQDGTITEFVYDPSLAKLKLY